MAKSSSQGSLRYELIALCLGICLHAGAQM